MITDNALGEYTTDDIYIDEYHTIYDEDYMMSLVMDNDLDVDVMEVGFMLMSKDDSDHYHIFISEYPECLDGTDIVLILDKGY